MADVEAMWILGDAYLNGGFTIGDGERFVKVHRNRTLAYKWLRRAALCGSKEAMLTLGAMYYSTAKTSQAFNTALRWELMAWRSGEVLAANNIAITYSRMGNARACFRWSRKSFESTNDGFLLALCYCVGYGVRKDIKKAREICEHILVDDSQLDSDREMAQRLIKVMDKKIAINLAIPISQTILPGCCR